MAMEAKDREVSLQTAPVSEEPSCYWPGAFQRAKCLASGMFILHCGGHDLCFLGGEVWEEAESLKEVTVLILCQERWRGEDSKA